MINEIAILMAAGLGTRMAPLTDKIPKPLIKVRGVSMIETIIHGLQDRGVSHIFVVVGYKKEQFQFLESKYKNLTLIENTEYSIKNNISSIYAACHVMGRENCFICESDLYVSDLSIFQAQLNQSCYYGKMVKGYSNDWVFKQDKTGKIVHIGKTGNDVYNMCGISYFRIDEAKIIADSVYKAYRNVGHEQLFWDEIVDQQLDKLNLTVHPIENNQIFEIDTVDELEVLDPDYKKYNY